MSNKDNKRANLNINQEGLRIHWGQMAASSLMTLIVTVIAGVAIYYFTRQSSPSPKLYYEQVPPTAFSTDKIKTVIQSFRVWNGGNKEAEDIQISIVIPQDAVITEQKIDTSGGVTIKVDIQNIDENTLLAKIESMNPGESVNFALLLGDTTDKSMQIEVRGKGVTGQQRLVTEKTESQGGGRNIPLSLLLFMITLVVIQAALTSFLYRRFRFRRRQIIVEGEANLNNYGFRLLNKGKIEEAKKYLQMSIDNEPGPFALGNMAQALAVEGNIDKALETCDIASDYKLDKHGEAFLDYCYFCIHLFGGDKEKAIAFLKTAVEKEKDDIVDYVNRNMNMAKWKDDKDIQTAILSEG